jgi:hypothetical protein
VGASSTCYTVKVTRRIDDEVARGPAPSPDPPKFQTAVSVLAQAVTGSIIITPIVASLIFITSPRAFIQLKSTVGGPPTVRKFIRILRVQTLGVL